MYPAYFYFFPEIWHMKTFRNLSELAITHVLLKASSVPAGLAFWRPSSSKVRHLHKAALAFVPNEPGNEIIFPITGSRNDFRCWALLSPAWQQICWSLEVRRPCCSTEAAWFLEVPGRSWNPNPPVSETSVRSETSRSFCVCTGPGLSATPSFHRLHTCGFPYKTMEQKVRTEMCFCSQHEYTLGSQYSLSKVTKYSLGWSNTNLLTHQAGESDTCFGLDRGSMWAHRCLPYCSPGI